MDKHILHCDLNSFFASVELLERPDLLDKPVAVCGDPKKRRGIILAKNEIAKAYGVKTAEPIPQALRKCPHLVLLEPHHDKFKYYSDQTNLIYLRYTNKVERFGIDESWLDVTKSPKEFGTPVEIADKIRKTVKSELGLTLSIGVSFNKVFAKLGSDLKKPDATSLISRENFKEKIYRLPTSDLLFIGRNTAEELKKMGIETIGDLAGADIQRLVKRFGAHATGMHDCANGIADDEVGFFGEESEAKSVGNSTTFDHDLFGEEEISAGLSRLADKVCDRLKDEGCKASTVRVTIKMPNLKSIQRQSTLNAPTNLRRIIFSEALKLAKSANAHQYPVRLLGISCSNLSFKEGEQLSLFGGQNKKAQKAEDAVLSLRKKFGRGAIDFGTSLLEKSKDT